MNDDGNLGNLKTLIWLALLSLSASAAHAATITVTSTADPGAGTLRQALLDANSSGDTLVLPSGTITLSSGELLVNKSLTLSGPGAK